jgi:FKBP-type peptidyl-prolyl cis-trans isomerase
VVLGLLTACNDDSPTDVAFEVIEEVTFDASLGIDLAQMTELPSGVYIRDLVVGGGPETYEDGEVAQVAYTGWLRNGQQFDAGSLTFGPGTAFPNLIPGFEIGLEGTAVGGTRLMVIPPELAYAQYGSGPIPPGAIVIFEVELDSIG